jgi:PPOX class probable FMN-dependent enzyme
MQSAAAKTNRSSLDASIQRSRKVRGGNFVQIATVDASGLPHCRTVVFRGFMTHNGAEVMRMITDGRSTKVKEIEASNGVSEMVWWFGKSSEQYRIQGTLSLVGEGTSDDDLRSARKQQWGNLSDSAREQFLWDLPGAPYQPQSAVQSGGRDSDGKLLPPPTPFLLMLLHPSRIEYLRLTDNFRQVDCLTDGDWICSRVNP